MYIGYPEKVLLDKGKQSQSGEFSALLVASVINRKDAGVESHNSLGEVGRYQAYLSHV